MYVALVLATFSHVCERHIKAPSDFAERILADSEHPLQKKIIKGKIIHLYQDPF